MNDRTPQESGARDMPPRIDARLLGLAADALAAVLPADAAQAERLFATPSPAWGKAAPADQQLGAWLRRHPSLGARDRRWLSDRVYDVLRHGRAYESFLEEGGRADADGQASAVWDRLPGLMRLSEALRTSAEPEPEAAAYRQWLEQQPPAVRFSLPDWLWEGLVATHGGQAETLAATLLLPAAIEIRSNLLKGKATALQKKLAEAGVAADTVPEAPAALRVTGRPALIRLPLFENGWFELQDAGSQAIAECGAARRGERVIDFCAGAGGKTLALAARMRNQGQVLAFDTDEARLSRLGPRLKRAGVDIVTQMRLKDSLDARLARYQGWADLVLVDAPCSGSGTLRRHPDLKWRLQPQEVAHYRQLQRQIMAAAARLLRPGGRLVYATCSLLADENEAQMAWLAHKAGGVSAVGGAAGAAGAAERAADPTGSGGAVGAGGVQATDPAWPAVSLQPVAQRYWLPQPEGGDVFFMASWTRA